jgi:hypothetical protein
MPLGTKVFLCLKHKVVSTATDWAMDFLKGLQTETRMPKAIGTGSQTVKPKARPTGTGTVRPRD